MTQVATRAETGLVAHRRLFVLSQAATLTGNWIQVVGLGVLALDATGSVGWTALVLSLRQLPLLVMGPITRALGNVARPARIGAVGQGLSAVASLALLLEDPGLSLLVVVGLVIGLLNGLDNSARLRVGITLWAGADSTSATAVNHLISSVARLLGPLIGASLLSIADVRSTIVANAASFALAGLGFARLDRTLPNGREGDGPPASAGRPRRMFRAVPVVPLAMVVVFVLFVMNLQAVMLVWLTEDLGFSESTYAWALAGLGLGGLVGALLGASAAKRLKAHVATLAVGSGLCLAPLGVVANFGVILVLMIARGFVGALLLAGLGVRFEEETRRLRDMGPVTVFASVLTGLAPIGSQVTGFVADLIGTRAPFWIGSIAMLGTGAVGVVATASERRDG